VSDETFSSAPDQARSFNDYENSTTAEGDRAQSHHVYLLASDSIPAGIVVVTFDGLKMEVLRKARLIGADEREMLFLFELLLRCEEYVYRTTGRLEFTDRIESFEHALRKKVSSYYKARRKLIERGVIAITGNRTGLFHFQVFSSLATDREVDPGIFKNQFRQDVNSDADREETTPVNGEESSDNDDAFSGDDYLRQNVITPGRARQNVITPGRARQNVITPGRARQDGIIKSDPSGAIENADEFGTKNALSLASFSKLASDLGLLGEDPKTSITYKKIKWVLDELDVSAERFENICKNLVKKKREGYVFTKGMEALFVRFCQNKNMSVLPEMTEEDKKLAKLPESQQEIIAQRKLDEAAEKVNPTVDPDAKLKSEIANLSDDQFNRLRDLTRAALAANPKQAALIPYLDALKVPRPMTWVSFITEYVKREQGGAL
jgi:hypothetical protein